MGSSFTVFFDGTFWVGVAEIGEPDGSFRAARHVFGAEPSNAQLLDFVRRQGSRLIDRALSSPAVQPEPGRGRITDYPINPVNPKRAARRAAREQALPGPSTAAQAALAKALEQSGAAREASRRSLRADEAERRREIRIRRRRARHRGH
jgi:hypothetical protein